jgi:pimeloyl-ACP methyl ester carboxylesterase
MPRIGFIVTATSRTPSPRDRGRGLPTRPLSGRRGHIGWIVAASLATGLVVALVLVFAPFIPAQESAVTGVVLCGFALGWAMLALLSARFTDQPQRWAAAPAVFMGLGGLVLLAFGSSAQEVLKWVWPPALLALVIWMGIRARRTLRSRSGRFLLYPLFAVLALAAIGGGYETLSEAADARAFPAPGKLIDVGGHKLHLNCTGSGSPTVVLEPGGAGMSATLGLIKPTVARGTRVCAYDRAGRGWSEPADTPQDGTQIANDLHTLLHRGNVPGPYVLAGHSFGGLYVLSFAARYPDEVAGMVLLDSTAPKAAPRPGATSPAQGTDDVVGRVSALISTSARFGLVRLYALTDFGNLPPRTRDEARAKSATSGPVRSTIDEYVQANSSIEEAAALRTLGDKPLFVLTAGTGSEADWAEKQNALAALSTNSAHRTIADATHDSLISEKEHADTAAQAINDVVASVRSGRPLVK